MPQLTIELIVIINGVQMTMEPESIDVGKNTDAMLRMTVGKLVNKAKQPIIAALRDTMENLRCEDKSE